jgi:hypothetical protein
MVEEIAAENGSFLAIRNVSWKRSVRCRLE